MAYDEDMNELNREDSTIEPTHAESESIDLEVNQPEEVESTEEKKPRIDKKTLKGFLIGMVTTVVLCLTAIGIHSFYFDKEAKIRRMIESNYLYEANEEDVQNGIYKGLVSGLGDPYSAYLTEEEMETTMSHNNGTYYGIGITLGMDSVTGELYVLECHANSPAQKAGIQVGDVIYKVDDELMAEHTTSDLVAMIQESSAPMHFTIIREGVDGYVEMDITPEEMETRTASGNMMEDDIGYIRITGFRASTVHQFTDALDNLQEQGMQRMIVDLRTNQGGLVTSVLQILDPILPDGVAYYEVDKNGNTVLHTVQDGEELNMPIVVLTSKRTASASEIFAGAVRDYGIGKLVGTNTFGKGITQTIYSLGDGTALKLTHTRYYTPSGVTLDGDGLVPDVEVPWQLEMRPDGQRLDMQLEKAIEVVKEM